jgi:hypothetical protein
MQLIPFFFMPEFFRFWQSQSATMFVLSNIQVWGESQREIIKMLLCLFSEVNSPVSCWFLAESLMFYSYQLAKSCNIPARREQEGSKELPFN